MLKYIVVDNHPNQIATIHLSNCRYLGEQPLLRSAGATRMEFDDGLEALAVASKAKTLAFCSHCLRKYKPLLAVLVPSRV